MKGQPLGGSSALGGEPGIGINSWRTVGRRKRDGGEETPGIRHLGVVEDLAHRARLHDLPAVHHADAVGGAGDHAEVVRDQDDGHTEPNLQLAHKLQDLGLNRHVERRGRLVGYEDLRVAGEGYGDYHPLAHAAGELVRVLPETVLGVRDADELEQLHGPLRRLAARQIRGVS